MDKIAAPWNPCESGILVLQNSWFYIWTAIRVSKADPAIAGMEFSISKMVKVGKIAGGRKKKSKK